MTYHYRKPPAEASLWWEEGRILLLAIIVLSLLGKACNVGLDHYQHHRQVSLAPVTPALAARDFDGDSLCKTNTAPVWVPISGAVILVYGIADYGFDLGGQHRQSAYREYWVRLQTCN